MKSTSSKEVAQELSEIIPLFHRKLIRPFGNQVNFALPPTHIITLINLKEKGTCTMTEMSIQMYLSKQQLTPIINNLALLGYVNREHDTVDRRNINLSLSESGSSFIENHKNEVSKMVEEKINCLDHDDLLTLKTSLADLFQVLSKLP